MLGAEGSMNRVFRSLSLLLLCGFAACASEEGSAAPGTGGTGGAGGAGSSEFPAEGPESIVREDTDDFVYFFPENLDAESAWPALVWFNGLSGYTEDFNYNGLLESITSWGFVVIGGKSSGMNPSDSDERTELLRRNGAPGDVLFGKVDESRIALSGHSLGAFQTTEFSFEYRVAAAIQGGGTPTTPDAAPTLFMTSEGDEVVSSSVVINSFDRAVNDAWLANHATADHNDPRTDGGVYREPLVAFLRWQLYDDPRGEAWFVGDSCVLCTDATWSFDAR